MKFYNPFKWHLFKVKEGTYCIRRFSWTYLSYNYLDKDEDFTWVNIEEVNKYCYGSFEAMERRLEVYAL